VKPIGKMRVITFTWKNPYLCLEISCFPITAKDVLAKENKKHAMFWT
jgi:hypothetical protein